MNSITAEVLKQTLFDKGLESIQDFLGYEIDPKENKDVIDRSLIIWNIVILSLMYIPEMFCIRLHVLFLRMIQGIGKRV